MANPNSYVDTLDNVNMHLKDICNALASDNCQFDILMTKKGQSATDPYSTAYTLQTLEFDSKDVIQTLLKLTAADYIENIKDDRKPGSPDFRVFGIKISNREIYIKEKMRAESCIFCISFHFAEYPLKENPYKNF
uniref:hypothetical protein n=1 Tax=Acetatifactor sp. TaxID=1872090 RepID=UPI00405689A3